MRYHTCLFLAILAPLHSQENLLPLSQESFKQAQERLSAPPLTAEEAYEKGSAAAKAEQLGEAEEWLEKALALNPDHVDALLRLSYVYLWQGRSEEAIAGFKKVLEKAPDYVDAREGLQKAEELLAGKEEEKKPEEPPKTLYEKEQIACIEKLIKEKKLERAFCLWRDLHCCFPETLEYTYQTGKLASWTGQWALAEYLLDSLTCENPFEGRAHLALAQQYLSLARWCNAYYHLYTLLELDPKSGEGFLARGNYWSAQRRFRAASCDYLRADALLEDEETKAIAWRSFYDARLLYKPSLRVKELYAEEKEVDLETKVESALIRTCLTSGRLDFSPFCKGMLYEELSAGYQRELNLVAKVNNYDVHLLRSTTGLDYYASPFLKAFGGMTLKQGRNSHSIVFPFRNKTTQEPFFGLSYRRPFHALQATFLRDSYIIKNFQENYSFFLLNDTVEGSYEYQFLPLYQFAGLSGYFRQYEDRDFNREGRGRLWVRVPLPKYSDSLSVAYQFEYGGFRRTDTDYYSFKQQWQHFAIATYRKSWAWLDLFEARYLHSWRSTRDLNQPINATFFLPRQFICTNKINLAIRKVFRKGFDVNLEGLYYWDTADYQAFLVKGDLRWLF